LELYAPQVDRASIADSCCEAFPVITMLCARGKGLDLFDKFKASHIGAQMDEELNKPFISLTHMKQLGAVFKINGTV